MGNLYLAFITGLTSGGISCLAVQGGLLTSSFAGNNFENSNISQKSKHVALFLVAKIVAYTLLGALLGLVGSAFFITPKIQVWMQIFVGIFMLATAARLLNLHPIFKYFVIQPPKSVFRLLKTTTKNQTLFAPLLLGALTVLVPCGVTQAMMILAVSSANVLWGALIMLFFILGTSPVFFTLGLATGQFLKNKAFSVIAALVIIYLGILSINNGQVLKGSVHTIQNYYRAIIGNNGSGGKAAAITKSGVQEVAIEVTNTGYKSATKVLKKGIPVRLIVRTNNVRSCARAFVIPSLNYSKILAQTGEEIIEFTPEKTGVLTYTCSMGMYTGSFNVVD